MRSGVRSCVGTIASGVLTTAGGLVFQGAQKGELSAYRDTDGMKLWTADPQTGVVAAPVTYEIDGEQYVAQLAGYGTRDYYAGNNSRLLVYKLDGKAQLPLPPATAERDLNPPPAFGTAEQLVRGERLYTDNCAMCHDTAYGNRGLFPDLRYSPMINSAEAFRAVVIDGALQSQRHGVRSGSASVPRKPRRCGPTSRSVPARHCPRRRRRARPEVSSPRRIRGRVAGALIAGDAAVLGEPRAEIHHPAALAAERPPRKLLRPRQLALAGGAADARCAHRVAISR